jgi:hypothetical protein
VNAAFFSGIGAGCLTAAGICLAGALFVLAVPPSHPVRGQA